MNFFKNISFRPTTTTTSISTTPQRPTVPSTEATSTVKYSSTIIQSSQFPSTFKKYVDSSETRKKFTTEKPNEMTTLPANPVKFLDDILDAIDRKETTTSPPPTTHRPSNNILSFVTSMPLRPSGFKPMPTEAPRNHSQKITFEKAPSDAMTLSEIFNSIAGNDENYSNEGNDVIYDTADSSLVEIKKPLPLSTFATSTPAPSPSPQPTQSTSPVQHKTLQQQMKNPQYVDLPVHQPPQLIAGTPQGSFNSKQPQQQQTAQYSNTHVGFPSDAFDDYVEFENPDDQYVRYEVQKPNVNMVKFQQMPLPSINNVVISPGQNSASFVLGSKQSVGSIGVGSSMGVGTSQFVNHNSNGPVKMGQVINDEPPVRQNNNNNNNNQIQASIRFPNDAESAFDNAPIIKGTFKLDSNVDGVHPPQALLQNQPAASQISLVTQKPLVFPSNNPHVMQAELSVGMSAPSPTAQPTNPSQVIFENVNEIYEKVNDKMQKQEVKEVSSNNLPPPSMLTPPSPIQINQFNRQQQYGPQRRPQKPNILPQFRPNSRLSQGHPHYRQEVGAIRVQPNLQFKPFPPQAVPKVGLPPMNPNMRRIPPPPPQNYRPQYAESSNRRVFKVPAPATQQFPFADRFMKPPPMQQPPLYYLNRPVTSANPETMQMQQRPSIVPYQDVELNKSFPPTPSINITSRNDNEEGNGKLEPVVTLQMLQAKKNGNKLNIPAASVPHEIPQDLSYLPKNHKNDVLPSKEPSVYVVYPVTGENQNSILNEEKKEEQLPLPSANEYQNTPFTVVSHFEQEPLLMKKDKKKQQFPYQIEKPAPPHVEKIPVNFNSPHGHSIYNIGEEPHDPISSKLTRITEKPIAIAYTPTEPSRISPPMSYYQHYQPQHLYSSPNFASPVISEIVDENHHGFDYDFYHRQHQLHSTYNSGEEVSEFHKQHYDFEAPFHASVSLSPEVTNPYQGWSILTTKPTETNKIDRSDLHVLDSSEEVSTKKYDPEEFQPVFESGFQPIYSSNRVSTAPELNSNSNEDSHELPSTLALSQTSPVSIVEKSASTTTEMPKIASNEIKSNIESTTAKAIEQKKPQSMEIDSLEALFDSLTRDYDDEDDSSASNKSENESRSL